VFFSDIADFHDISLNSFPIDIVHFLNELYNFMDRQIVKYDVFKVTWFTQHVTADFALSQSKLSTVLSVLSVCVVLFEKIRKYDSK